MQPHFATAPRQVPFSLIVLNHFSLLGQIAWGVFGFGSIFFWTFAMNGDFSFLTMRGALQTVQARITQVEATGASVNDSTVMANHYQFSVAGRSYSGVSYSTGEVAAKGQEISVEYTAGDPLTSRVVGMRRKMFGPFVAIVAVFPLIGLLLALFNIRGGFRKNHLLRNGLLAMGKLVDKQPTNMTVNARPVYELTFEFTARDGQRHQAKSRSHNPENLEDEPQEALLYDPEHPARAYLLDEAPARPKVDMTGAIEGRPAAAVFAMVIPALALLINTAFVWGRL